MFLAFCRAVIEWLKIAYEWANEHRRLTLGIACIWLGIVLGAVAMKSFAGADVHPPEIDVECDEATNKCTVAYADLMKVSQNYFAALKELKTLRARTCKFQDV